MLFFFDKSFLEVKYNLQSKHIIYEKKITKRATDLNNHLKKENVFVFRSLTRVIL